MEKLGRNLQLSDFTKIPFDIYRLVGIRVYKYDPDEKQPLKEKIAFSMAILNLTIHFFLKNAVPFYHKFEDPIELTAFACYAGFVINSLCKIIAVWCGRFFLKEVLVKMEEIFPKTEEDIIQYRLDEYYKKIEFYMRTLTIYHFSTTTMFNFFPLIQSIVEKIITGEDFVYRFPFILVYPGNEKQFPIFLFAYFYQIMAAYILSCFFLGSDLLLVSIVHLACMHFDYLGKKITDFEPTGTDRDLIDLGKFVKYHDDTLSLSFKINEVFKVSILMNYIASCGVICMIGFQITAGSEILDMLKFFAFLISSLVHVYFICSFGSNLLDVSGNIADAVFSHRWYMANNKYKKSLPLLLARSHKPAFLTAFKFFIVSMESFKSLGTTSYQFFTLIKTKYDEEE
ncbi:odorant receptor 85c-like [Eupeodes corollae]|uniref:Odorant receptor n=1 Tax=Scaeva pyrastri TaxID=219539 RepID=A0A1B3B7A6_SCAPY|nr:odorant receptor 85c-like [Eupeodes corollae]AOE48096.1 putative odorant receptor OR30 [Scaeva pyrastri]